MKMKSQLWLAVLVFFIFSSIAVSEVSAHSLFNSAEEFLGGYRVQVATQPEFPNIGENSQILFRVTDGDFNEVYSFSMGIRVFLTMNRFTHFNKNPMRGPIGQQILFLKDQETTSLR